ncbi:hypothetical protein I3843_11G169500 [Carya illinoinensis]|uniref:Uncharacterized protein n=1 Tax=Carya illinoinensis TaxID=32201 RepID=A0A8T1P7Q7_CARIL|nr:uncharacterized protein LOC122282019 [Carya illinoinensis]KAG6637372.1 hypothetical protein CIPAW_11G174300 [Carya illinoinensis]KAG7957349.1 hypothetical protein I3843_11G169500 [Carya illinoinensis]
MQSSTPQKQATQSPAQQVPTAARTSLTRSGSMVTGNRGRKNNHVLASPRAGRAVCTCSNHPGSVRCTRHGYAVPETSSRRRYGSKEVLVRRALTPPTRRLSLRWWNFRPTPSRLSNMSVA